MTDLKELGHRDWEYCAIHTEQRGLDLTVWGRGLGRVSFLPIKALLSLSDSRPTVTPYCRGFCILQNCTDYKGKGPELCSN